MTSAHIVWPGADVVFAASGGGHLELLADSREVVAREHRAWVTVQGARAQALRNEGERVYTVPSLDRENLAPANLWQSLRLAHGLRPRLVITSGAGVVLGFAGAARRQGARVIFVETMARVSAPSLSGRIFGHLASRNVVQWPELLGSYPRARLCRPSLLPRRVPPIPTEGHGTFISVGTHSMPFDRLLSAADAAAASGVLPGPIVAQVGDSRFSSSTMQIRKWLPRDEFVNALRTARVVVGHCGAGLLGAAIRLGHRPLVLPRRAAQHEHVDDHQEQLLRKLSELDLIVPIEDGITRALVGRTQAEDRERVLFDGTSDLVDVLAQEISSLVRA